MERRTDNRHMGKGRAPTAANSHAAGSHPPFQFVRRLAIGTSRDARHAGMKAAA